MNKKIALLGLLVPFTASVGVVVFDSASNLQAVAETPKRHYIFNASNASLLDEHIDNYDYGYTGFNYIQTTDQQYTTRFYFDPDYIENGTENGGFGYLSTLDGQTYFGNVDAIPSMSKITIQYDKPSGEQDFSIDFGYTVVDFFHLDHNCVGTGHNGVFTFDFAGERPNYISLGFMGGYATITSIDIEYECSSSYGTLPTDYDEFDYRVSFLRNYDTTLNKFATTVSIDGFKTVPTGSDLTITLPTSFRELPVTCIGYGAFDDFSDYYNGFGSLNGIKKYVLPSTVNCIHDDAFKGNRSLTEINIPYGIKTIESSTFSGCVSLTTAELPLSVKEIGQSAFRDCNLLNFSNFPTGITLIWSDAFKNCTSLSCVLSLTNVIRLHESAFQNCSSLTDVRLGDSLEQSYGHVFEGCIGLTSIYLNRNVLVGTDDFDGCTNLHTIYTNADSKEEVFWMDDVAEQNKHTGMWEYDKYASKYVCRFGLGEFKVYKVNTTQDITFNDPR